MVDHYRPSDIRDAIKKGQEAGDTHLIMWMDDATICSRTYVKADEDVRKVKERILSAYMMTSIHEVFFLNGDIDAQLALRPCLTYE